MNAISDDNKVIAKTLASAFGGQPRIVKFWDENHKSNVDILISEDSPQRKVTSYGTVNLSDSPLVKDGVEYKTRVEIVGACASGSNDYASVLATAAFCIINTQWFCYPGAIFPDVLAMYKCSSTMQHFLFVPPFLWGDGIQTLSLKTKTVAWLLAIPISEEERRYSEKYGTEALENIFTEKQIDIFNLNRPSVV